MIQKLYQEWLKKAEEDYQVALVLSRKIKPSFLNSVCFHSQQAAEKYLKAYLVLNKVRFPKTHDLILLKNFCRNCESEFELISDLIMALNPYSVEFRYPGEDATRKDTKRALIIVEEIRKFILERMQKV